MLYLFVGIGGILGSLFRYFLSISAVQLVGKEFPAGTLFINLSGALLLGWFTRRFVLSKKLNPYFTTAFSTGFIGSYTTFSTFCFESVNLLQTGYELKGIIYILVSLFGGLLFVRLGLYLGSLGSKEAGRIA